jgi:hypothetical protein
MPSLEVCFLLLHATAMFDDPVVTATKQQPAVRQRTIDRQSQAMTMLSAEQEQPWTVSVFSIPK